MGTYTGLDKRLQYLFEHGGGGGGSANIWTGTMAEYLAQASQIADGTQINITDDEIQSLVVASYDIYSEEEREVGVWTDGKPLYQKSFIWNDTTIGSFVSHDISALSVDTLVSLKGWAERYVTASGLVLWHPLNYYESSNYSVASRYNEGAQTIDIKASYASGNQCRKQIVTIQYTKTTDVAGSGLFVPSGALAEHYSTSEQVVGTWIDGKPIYRITLPEVSFGTTDVTYTHNLGIKQYIKVYGSCTINNTTYPKAFPFYQHKWNHFCEINNYYENYIIFSSDWNNNKAIVTLEYTKLSDYT